MSVPSDRQVLEAAIGADFEDRTAHAALADLLIDQGDPLGELIRVQLALEDNSLSFQARTKLVDQEQKLLAGQRNVWLGPLLNDVAEADRNRFEFTFRRGWLTTIRAPYLSPGFCHALAALPIARHLHELSMEELLAYDSAPENLEQVVRQIDQAPFAQSLRCVTLGEQELPEDFYLLKLWNDDDDASAYEWDGYPADATELVSLLRVLPNLEQLRVVGENPDLEAIFSGSWPRLRVLEVARFEGEAPIWTLADNPAMAHLNTLSLWPHGRNIAVTDYEAFVEFVRSPHLKSLEHLRIRFSDIADSGVRALVEAGWLSRLKTLDLRHGCVSDEGAFRLAADPNIWRLECLDLCRNMLTGLGVQRLHEVMREGTFLAKDQHLDLSINPNVNYLYEEEWE